MGPGAALNAFLDPIREKRAEIERRPDLVDEILASGTIRARAEAQRTLHQVREAMKLDYFGS